MPLSDELVLQTQAAFRELDALQGRLDRISDVRLDVTVDTSSVNSDIERTQRLAQETAGAFGQIEDQVVLTTDQYRIATAALEQGVDAAHAVDVALNRAGAEASTAEAALSRVATFLDLSEDEASRFAAEIGQSVEQSTVLERDLRQVAREMGLSEDEARQFTSQMQRASSEASTLEQRTDRLNTGMGRLRGLIAGAVAAFGVRGLVNQFNQAIDSTLALSESVNAVNVIFDEGAESVLNFAETAAESAGLAASQAQQLVVPIGASLRNFGFSAQEAGDAAVILTQRAADLASVFNSEVPEALGAIQAALRGETDPIERFGASISAARVEAFALANGLAATKSEITDAIKVQARYGLILQDTAASAGDFANTSDEAANQQRILAAQAEEARAALGESLLGAYQSILSITPRFLIDLQATAESIRTLAGDAESAEGPLITLGDTIAGIPRGFGVLSDVVTGLGGAIGNAATGFANLFAGPLTGQGFDAFNEDVEQGTAALQGMFDSLQQRAILESFISDLKAGVDPALAFANAVAATARNNELTAESFAALSRISGATPERLGDATVALLEQGAAAGLSADEIRVLQTAMVGFRREVGQTAGPGSPAQTFASDLQEAQLAAEEFELAEKEQEVADFAAAMEGVAGIAEETGLSFRTVANNIGFFDEELAPLVNDVGAAALATEAFSRSLDGLVAATRFDLSDAVDEFDLLIEKTNEAGDEVPATVEEMLTDLQTQADRFARLESATTILEALGFDALASELRQQGPEAVDAAEEFVDDIASAVEAEDILTQGGDIGDDLVTGLQDALTQGDITPAMLDLVSEFTSSQVQTQVLLAAAQTGELFGAELQRVINALPLELRLTPEIIAINPRQGPGGTSATLPGAEGGGGGGGTSTNVPGGVNVFQTNNFNTTPVPTTDTQRITQTTANVIRSNLK